MKKPKIKIKEIKSKIKIISEVKEEESLEEMVDMEEDSPVVNASSTTNLNPSLTQRFAAQERTFTESKQEEKKREEAITYHALNQKTSSRSYDPTIRSSGDLTSSQQSSTQRIDPSLQNSASSFMEQTRLGSNDLRDSIGQRDIEPSMRKFKRDGERDYQVERVENYVAKRRTDA